MASLKNITDIYNAPRNPFKKRYDSCEMSNTEEIDNENFLENYPVVNMQSDSLNTSAHKINFVNLSNRSVIIPVHESVIKRITRTFFEYGFSAVLEEGSNQETQETFPIFAAACKFIINILQYYDTIKSNNFLNKPPINVEDIARFSENRDWLNSYIRYMAWHPNCFKLAVAIHDDVVRIYKNSPKIVCILKNSVQKLVSCLAWRPLCSSEIAVGCEKGICYWTVEKTVHFPPVPARYRLIRNRDNLPVTSLQWNRDGTKLISSTIGNRFVEVMDFDSYNVRAIRRIGPPLAQLKWSPNDEYIFASTRGKIFHIWEVQNKWKHERWELNGGYVQSACWSPCGLFLFFVTTTESILYRLDFNSANMFADCVDQKHLLPVADLSPTDLGTVRVGGLPQQLAFAPFGDFLVITFKDSNCITVFRTRSQRVGLQIAPSYYIRGGNTECPNFICFQSIHRLNTKTILTIAWSSGRIEYVQLH